MIAKETGSAAQTSYFLEIDTELESSVGYDFFSKYFQAMLEANNGVVDPDANKIIEVRLKGLSAELYGFGYAHVYGLVEFSASVKNMEKTYCSSMVDGDIDAPVGKYSFDTRRGALRKMVSGSTRRALEAFIHDLSTL
jgi:hypothetical protein